MQGDDFLQKDRLGTRDILDGLARHRVRQEADEIAGMALRPVWLTEQTSELHRRLPDSPTTLLRREGMRIEGPPSSEMPQVTRLAGQIIDGPFECLSLCILSLRWISFAGGLAMVELRAPV
jgi:hypothetical protein